MAVKQIDFGSQNTDQMRQLVDEIRNFETITHANLVRYFGVEVHRDQLLIFMVPPLSYLRQSVPSSASLLRSTATRVRSSGCAGRTLT